jgi:hypothetical protein
MARLTPPSELSSRRAEQEQKVLEWPSGQEAERRPFSLEESKVCFKPTNELFDPG